MPATTFEVVCSRLHGSPNCTAVRPDAQATATPAPASFWSAALASVTQFTPDEERSLAEKHTLPRMLSIPFAGLGMALNGLILTGVVAWNQASPWMVGVLVAFTASMMFCWTSALHEAAHQTLFKSRALSIWCGRFLVTMMFTPYTAYREVHIRQHA